MNEDIVRDVLEDVLQELKEANRALIVTQSSVDALEKRTSGFEQMLKDQQVIVQPPDLAPAFEDIRQLTRESGIAASKTVEAFGKKVKDRLDEVQTVLSQQPRPILRQWRVSFFPESDKEGSYKYFIRWIFGGSVLVLLVGTLFALGRQYLDKWHPSAEEASRPMTMSLDKVAQPLEKATIPPETVKKAVEAARKAQKRVDSIAMQIELSKYDNKLKEILMYYQRDGEIKNGANLPQK